MAGSDKDEREALRRSLSFHGYEVTGVEDGASAVEAIGGQHPELAIIDASLKEIDGLTVSRSLRSTGYQGPLLMLCPEDDSVARVMALDAGADDVMSQPYALEELLARMRSLLRRAHVSKWGHEAPTRQGGQCVLADLELNPDTREVRRGGRPIELTRTEFELLEVFLRNPRRVMARTDILREVWGNTAPSSGNVLEVYIGYLRRKLEKAGEARLIHTVRGVGYVLRHDEEKAE